MLAIVATMCGLDICDVSHHRCASVGFGWHRRDTSGIPRCTGPLCALRAHVEAQCVDSAYEKMVGSRLVYGSAYPPGGLR